MSVGAVGGIGMGAAGAMSAGGATAPGAAGATGANGTAGAESAGAATPGKINTGSIPVTSIADLNLPAEVQTDFNSIDLLIALLLMAAMGKKDDEKSTGSTALGFLAGLAMAGAMGEINLNGEGNTQASVEEVAPNAPAGGQLNVTA